MPKPLKLRAVTPEEEKTLRRLAAARTEAFRVVQRARLLTALLDDPKLTATEAGRQVGFKSEGMGPAWGKRFNAEGLAGLADRPRPGRKATHSEPTRSALIALALQKPSALGYPFALWTLERLQAALKERAGVHLSDSTIWTWLAQEGLQWKRQQSWFQAPERHDPEFEAKRGRLSPLT